MPKQTTSANLGFENQLWDAACILWGSIPAADYRKVIVGLIFLRYTPQRSSAATQSSSPKVRALRKTATPTRRRTSSSFPKRRAGKPLPARRTHLK